MGATRGMILRIFMLSGASVGVVGTLAGFVARRRIRRAYRGDPPVRPEHHRHRSVLRRDLFPDPDPGARRPVRGRRRCWRWRSACRSWRRSIRPGARRGSIRSRRCVMSERAAPRSSCAQVVRTFHQAGAPLPVLRGVVARAAAGRDRGAGRPVGRRQIDAAAHRGPAGAAGRRRGAARRPRLRRACPIASARACAARPRLRLSVPSSAAGILGAGERHAAADDRRRAREGAARARALELLGQVGLAAARRASPGAALGRRAAARRHRPRARQHARACCWATSPPAISITTPPTR